MAAGERLASTGDLSASLLTCAANRVARNAGAAWRCPASTVPDSRSRLLLLGLEPGDLLTLYEESRSNQAALDLWGGPPALMNEGPEKNGAERSDPRCGPDRPCESGAGRHGCEPTEQRPNKPVAMGPRSRPDELCSRAGVLKRHEES